LVQSLDAATSYHCADLLMDRLTPQMQAQDVDAFIHQSNHGKTMRERWNALYALGKLCWAGNACTGSHAGVKPDPKTRAMDMLVQGKAKAFQEALRTSIMSEWSSGILANAVKIGRTGNWLKTMSNLPALRQRLAALANDSRLTSRCRFAIAEAWASLVDVQHDVNDFTFLLSCLNSWDKFVLRVCANSVPTMYPKLAAAQRVQVSQRLKLAMHGPLDIITLAALAVALDACIVPGYKTGMTGPTEKRVRHEIHARYLTTTVTLKLDATTTVSIHSSLSPSNIQCWATLIVWERAAYHHMFPVLAKTITGKPLPKNLQVNIFPNSEIYNEYMTGFIGDGNGAGGFFAEKEEVLYTFQRTPARFFISVEELILHEITHYFNKHHVFAFQWDSANSNKEPSTWLDEGLAEFMSGLNFDPRGCFTTPLRENYMTQICKKPFNTWSLQALLESTKNATFHYQMGYSFVYFMATQHSHALQNILVAFRTKKYMVNAWQSITGHSVSQTESMWKAALRTWCARSYKHLPDAFFLANPTCPTPATPASPAGTQCGVVGHGTRRMNKSMQHDLSLAKLPY